MTETAQSWPDRTRLPIAPFQEVGRIERTIADSDPVDWPKEIAAPEGRRTSCW